MSSAREWVVTDFSSGYKSLSLRECEQQIPGPGEVRLRVEAFALNWGDMDLMRDVYSFSLDPLPARVGIEAAGIVDMVGPGVEGVEIGQRYCTLPYFYYNRGTSADSVTIAAKYITKAPEGLSAVESTSIWMRYMTAYFPVTGLQSATPESNILVTAGTSTAGSAALNIGKIRGANMIATTRFESNTEYLKSAGANHVFVSSGQQSLSDFLEEATDGKGVHVIFDCVAGELMSEYVKKMAKNARIYYYGLLGGSFPDELPIVEMFDANASFHPYSVFHYVDDETTCAECTAFVYDGIASGALATDIDRVFPMEEFIEAWDYMKTERKTHGKIVIETGLS